MPCQGQLPGANFSGGLNAIALAANSLDFQGNSVEYGFGATGHRANLAL
jgi:hypothetical protein